ncbi:MAG: serine protease [Planctomycetia bacterium]|nr:serine protease [Planctomycetia bacterium]
MRHGTGSPLPDLDHASLRPAGSAGSRRQRVCSLTPGRRSAALVISACLALACSRQATAQNSFWGWGLTGNPTTTWSSENLADYMLTGHAPHPAVARIVAPESSGASLGSGVLVDVNRSQGLVLTNWHVIRDSRSAVLVQFPDGFQSAGTVVRWDEAWDLAAIVIWKPTATPISVAETPPRIGERLTIAGFGRGVYREESGECTEYLSPGTGYAKEFVELKASARQGDSGGPIFNEQRQLAGVLFGQNDGRTIGSCSTRVRSFLGSVGSKGFTPLPLAEFSNVRALDRGIGTAAAADRIAATPVSDAVHRSTFIAAPVAPVPMAAAGVGNPPPPPWPGQPVPQEPSPLAGLGLPAWLPDPYVHRGALLSAAGGLALAFLGLKMLLGRRQV